MGTHNSYHIAPPPQVIHFLELPLIRKLLGRKADLVPSSWEVTQAPLTQQLQRFGEDTAPSALSPRFTGS